MGDFNDYRIPAPCLRLDYGFGNDWASIELGDGAGYVSVSALGLACGEIADMSGTCPLDMHGDELDGWRDGCERRCSADIDYADCWMRYFEEKAGRER